MMGLGIYAEGFASWQKVLAGTVGIDPEARREIFGNAAVDVAGYVANGLAKVLAADGLWEIAQAHGLVAAFGADAIQADIAEAFKNIDRVPDESDKSNGKEPPTTPAEAHATIYLLPDPALIPKRAWLYGTHYMRGAVTATVAPGGFGKTTLALYEAMKMATNGVRVWYISGEDDHDEIDRRIAAYCKVEGNVTDLTLGGNLFVDDKISFPFKVARTGGSGVQFDAARLLAFENAIERDRIDAVILDPFISFHLLSENDTSAMDGLIKRLGEICLRRMCSLELSHHVRKPSFGQSEITVYDARGAGAIVNAVRSCRVLNQMSSIEAEQAEITPEQRTSYIRIDSGKRNMAPPEKAKWCKLVSVQIANGDNVQGLEPFVFKPRATTDEDVEWIKIILRERPYRADSRSEDWLGHKLAAHFGRDISKGNTLMKGNIIWINGVLKRWEAEGHIEKVKAEDEERHQRMFFTLPKSKK